MAIDLNALNNMYARKEASQQDRVNKIKEGLSTYLESTEIEEKNILGSEGKGVDAAITNINVNSTQEEIDAVTESNNQWLEQSLSIAKNDNEKVLYNSIYENKQTLINNIEDDKTNFDAYNTTLDTKLKDIEKLQTTDNKFDFTQITDLLDDYRTAGENILNFNKNWVHKDSYEDNVSNIAAWIKQGKKLSALDQSKTETGVQVKGAEERPIYQQYMNESYDLWLAGSVGQSNLAINAAIGSIDAIARTEAATAQEKLKLQFESDKARVATYDIDDARTINNFLVANKDTPFEEIDLSKIASKDRNIVANYLASNGEYETIFNEQYEELESQDYLQDEQGVLQVIQGIQSYMGEGFSLRPGENLSDEEELMKKLKDPGTFSVGKDVLKGKQTRREVQNIAANNISEIFNHLEGGSPINRIASIFRQQYAGSKDIDIDRFVNGDIDKNSVEYLEVLDKIVDIYYPADKITKVRKRSSDAKDLTQHQFSGDEAGQFNLLMDQIKLYSMLRDMDIEFNQDDTNPANLPD